MIRLRMLFAAVMPGVRCASAAADKAPIGIAHTDTFSGPTASVGTTVARTLRYAVDLIKQDYSFGHQVAADAKSIIGKLRPTAI